MTGNIKKALEADKAARIVASTLSFIEGAKVYVVGGAVRDGLLGEKPKDVDLLVTGVSGKTLERTLGSIRPASLILTGKDFGVYRFQIDGFETEIALPRTENSTGAKRRDFEVQVNPFLSVEDDLGRRDFTVNAMAYDVETEEAIDPFLGAWDLETMLIRPVHRNTFVEDPTRILRAFVMQSKGFRLDANTQELIQRDKHLLALESKERIQTELDKIFSNKYADLAVMDMNYLDILKYVFPICDQDWWNFDQKSKYHTQQIGPHCLSVLRLGMQETADVDLRYSLFLHDLGKPASVWTDEEGWRHYYQNDKGEGFNHEDKGAELAREMLTELKFPNARIDRICKNISGHMYGEWSSKAGARKFINRWGDAVDDLMIIRLADGASGKPFKDVPIGNRVAKQRALVEEVRKGEEPTDKSMLAVNGNDLLALGMTPSKELGIMLDKLVETVLESPELNTKEQLLELVRGELND